MAWSSGQRACLLFDDPSSNPTKAYSFYCKLCLRKEQKESGAGPLISLTMADHRGHLVTSAEAKTGRAVECRHRRLAVTLRKRPDWSVTSPCREGRRCRWCHWWTHPSACVWVTSQSAAQPRPHPQCSPKENGQCLYCYTYLGIVTYTYIGIVDSLGTVT